MENPALGPIVVLKIENLCCPAYQKKLNKELYKLNGVISISLNPHQSLVSIRGKVDPDLLLNTVAKTGKYAEMVYFNKNPSKSSDHHHGEEFRHRENACDKQRWSGERSGSNSQQHRNCSFQESKCHKVEEEEEHKCEKYVPPPIDERLCRDYYCRDHRMRPVFSGNYTYNFGGFPHHASLNSYPRYRYAPSNAYGFRSGRFGQGLGGYGYSKWSGW